MRPIDRRRMEKSALLAGRMPADRVLPRPILRAVSARTLFLIAAAIAIPYLAMRGMAMAESALTSAHNALSAPVNAGGTAPSNGLLALIGLDGMVPRAEQTGLVVQHITVSGRNRTAAADVLAALQAKRGTPTLDVDPHAARDRLLALPWVAEATVERRLPDRVHVSMVERQPLALWQHQGIYTVIDREGVAIDVDPANFADLVILVGADAPAQADGLFTALRAAPDVATRLRAATFVSGRRWTLRLDAVRDGLDIILPEHGQEGALHRLTQAHADQGLLDKDLVQIDMRMPDRMVVRLTDRPDADPADTGPETATDTAIPSTDAGATQTGDTPHPTSKPAFQEGQDA